MKLRWWHTHTWGTWELDPDTSHPFKRQWRRCKTCGKYQWELEP